MTALELAEKLIRIAREVGDANVVVDGIDGFGQVKSIMPNVVVESRTTGVRAIHVVYRRWEGGE